MVLALAAMVSACAPTRAPSAPDHSWVSLPVAQAGVHDQRLAFAQVFDAELRRYPSPDTPAGGWLHLPSPQGQALAAVGAIEQRFGRLATGTVVLVVPGLFGDCVSAQSVPFGDGQLRTPARSATEAYGGYADLGLKDLRMLPLPGRASSQANGLRLAEALHAEAAHPGVERIVLVAYSKGVPDVLHALQQLSETGGIPPQVQALVSVAGIAMGTPLADRYDTWYAALTQAFDPLDCSPSEGGEVASLTLLTRGAWLASHPPPPPLRYHSVLAHAPQEAIAWPLRPFHAQLSDIDARNDGQVAASHAVLPGSSLLAEARTDHWGLVLPRERHPSAWWRAMSTPERFPREALFRALIKWVVADLPGAPAAPRP